MKKGLDGDRSNPSTELAVYGGAEGARTPDLMTASHALSQLSYSPEKVKEQLTNTGGGVNR